MFGLIAVRVCGLCLQPAERAVIPITNHHQVSFIRVAVVLRVVAVSYMLLVVVVVVALLVLVLVVYVISFLLFLCY